MSTPTKIFVAGLGASTPAQFGLDKVKTGQIRRLANRSTRKRFRQQLHQDTKNWTIGEGLDLNMPMYISLRPRIPHRPRQARRR